MITKYQFSAFAGIARTIPLVCRTQTAIVFPLRTERTVPVVKFLLSYGFFSAGNAHMIAQFARPLKTPNIGALRLGLSVCTRLDLELVIVTRCAFTEPRNPINVLFRYLDW